MEIRHCHVGIKVYNKFNEKDKKPYIISKVLKNVVELERDGIIYKNIDPNRLTRTHCPVEPDYKKAYNILMEYFHFIPDEDKLKINKELKKYGFFGNAIL